MVLQDGHKWSISSWDPIEINGVKHSLKQYNTIADPLNEARNQIHQIPFTSNHLEFYTVKRIPKSRANWKLERRVQTLLTRVALADNVKGIKTGTTYDQWNLESKEILHFLRQAVGFEGWYVECVNLLLFEVSLIGVSSYLDERFLLHLSIDQVLMPLWAVTKLQ